MPCLIAANSESFDKLETLATVYVVAVFEVKWEVFGVVDTCILIVT